MGRCFPKDPVEVLEQEEMSSEYLTITVEMVQKLPPRQQLAMICALKEQVDDTIRLVDAFKKRGMDIELMGWPADKQGLHRLKASLSTTRKKIRTSFAEKHPPLQAH